MLVKVHLKIPKLFTKLIIEEHQKGPYSSRMELNEFYQWCHSDSNILFTINNRASRKVVSFWSVYDHNTGVITNEFRQCWPKTYVVTKKEIFSQYRATRQSSARVPSDTKLREGFCKCLGKFNILECVCSVCLQTKELLSAFHRNRVAARRQRNVNGYGISCCDSCIDRESQFWRCTASGDIFTKALLCDYRLTGMFSLKVRLYGLQTGYVVGWGNQGPPYDTPKNIS